MNDTKEGEGLEKNKSQWFREWFRKENKGAIGQLGLLLGLGVVFLVMGQSFFPDEPEEPITIQVADESPYADKIELETQVAEILSKVEGAGTVQVMITYQDRGVFEVAREENLETSQSLGSDINETTAKSENTILLTEDANGATSPFLLQSQEPSVEGVVIVAEGGGNAVVSQRLFTAAQALFDVPAHKIAVLQMSA